MTATSRAPRRPRIPPRGPPPAPTPIRTARGSRSAAADERVLAEFLEASLRVPDLSLPPRKRFSFPPAPPPEPLDAAAISSRALVAGDAAAARRAVAAAAESGAVRVTGAVDAREVRDAVEAALGAVFAAPEEVKRGLMGRWLFRGRRDGAATPGEFFWFRRPMSADEDRAMDAAFPGSTYRAFRYQDCTRVTIDAREVRDVVEAGLGTVFAAPEEVKRGLMGRWFRNRNRDGGAPGEEFFWFRPMGGDEDRAMAAAFPGSTYRALREKMDNLASKMEDVAKVVVRVLSDNIKYPKASAQFREGPSILCLTLYSSNMSRTCSEFDCTTAPNSHALSIHLSGHDRRICLRNLGGSTFSSLPAGCMLVTIGKQIQEWSNGQFKASAGEVLFEMTDEPGPFISVELMYCPDDRLLSEVGRHASRIDRPMIVSFRDQILIALILLFSFYLIWC